MADNTSRRDYRHFLVQLGFSRYRDDAATATDTEQCCATGVMLGQFKSKGRTCTLVLTSKATFLGLVENYYTHNYTATKQETFDGIARNMTFEKNDQNSYKMTSGHFRVVKGKDFYQQRLWVLCEVYGFPDRFEFPRKPEPEATYTWLQVSHLDANGRVIRFHAAYNKDYAKADPQDIPDYLPYTCYDQERKRMVECGYYLNGTLPTALQSRTTDHKLQLLEQFAEEILKTAQRHASIDVTEKFSVAHHAGEGAPVFDHNGALFGIVVMNSKRADKLVMLRYADIEKESGLSATPPEASTSTGGSSKGEGKGSGSGSGQGGGSRVGGSSERLENSGSKGHIKSRNPSSRRPVK